MIPAEVIAEVRARNDLVAFIESAGVQLRRRGADYVGLCPFHRDSSPSLVVSPRKQYWCCHGACSAGGKRVGGDVIEFARRLWGVGFREAVARLDGGVVSAEAAPAAKEKATPAPALLERVAGFYAQALARSEAAVKYLASRGITRPELLTALLAGFADGSLIETAPAGSPIRRELESAGLITAAGAEFFFRCVVLPLRDLAGVVAGMYGRAIDGDRHLYLPGPRRGLLNAACAATTNEIIITESAIDAMSFLEAGIPTAVPIYGVNGWTADHDELLEKHRIRRVVLALDSDEAGQKASAAISEKLLARAIDVTNVVLPAKDANELLVKLGADGFAAEWKRLVSSAASTQTVSSAPSEASHAAKEKDATLGLSHDDGAYVVAFEKRTYRIRGLAVLGVDRLRVNVRVEQDGRFHVDTFDLYSARGRRSFQEAVTEAFGLAESDGAALTTELATVIEALERERVQLKARGRSDAAKHAMTAAERDEAMAFLMSPNLIDLILEDFRAVGCVGEETAMLTGYLAALSRLLPEEALAVLCCARSGAGKSVMQKRIVEFVPPESLIERTCVTKQALFYKDENALVHKVLAIDEEGGAVEAAYALRSLQSAGYLSITSTRTDPQTGKQRAEDYRVNGPVAIFLTTAHPEALDYETRNRFMILTIDESKEQTRRILEKQRRDDTLDGLISAEAKKAILRRHHNAQRLLQAIRVVNPFANELTYPTDRLILRREQKKYLMLIKTIALLNQYQRERKTQTVAGETITYIEVTRRDIEIATGLAQQILRRNLDELAPPSRSLLIEIRRLVVAKMKEQKIPQHHAIIDRKEIQEATGLSLWHLRDYLQQLVEYEYLVPLLGRKGRRYVYELVWDGIEEAPAEPLKNPPSVLPR
jgi:DNA primase catalytic core